MLFLFTKILVQAFAAFLIGTVVFDFIHYFLHRCLKSRFRLARKIGRIHTAHHNFFPSNLKINLDWQRKNLLHHVLMEYTTQVIATLGCAAFFNPFAILLAVITETIIFICVCHARGLDIHHRSYTQLPPDRGGLFVSGAYHALHHVYPTQYFSSYIKLVDWIFGTGCHLAGNRIAMTGASGALGSNMKHLLEREVAIVMPLKFGVDYTYTNYAALNVLLADADILFLCHGSKYESAQEANCDSFVRIIELFKASHARSLVPREIWGVGSEIECHPCFGIKKIQVYAASKRNYAKHARAYFHDETIQYRHLVHSAFTSRMGVGLLSAQMAARLTLFLIKRGCKYVPVTYTGFAYLNYIRYMKYRTLYKSTEI